MFFYLLIFYLARRQWVSPLRRIHEAHTGPTLRPVPNQPQANRSPAAAPPRLLPWLGLESNLPCRRRCLALQSSIPQQIWVSDWVSALGETRELDASRRSAAASRLRVRATRAGGAEQTEVRAAQLAVDRTPCCPKSPLVSDAACKEADTSADGGGCRSLLRHLLLVWLHVWEGVCPA